MPRTVRTTRPPISPDRATRRAMRAAQAATERRIAFGVLGVIAFAIVFGAVIHAQTGSAHAVTANAALAEQTATHATQKCPYNGCTASTCHGKSKPPSAKHGTSVASAKSSKPTSASAASSRRRSTASTSAKPSSSSTSAQVAAKARVTASASAARKSAALAASAKPKITKVAAVKPSPKKSSSPAPASAKDTPRVITIVTFGYSFGGPPAGCKFVADVRNIDAGTFLQTENGLMASVRNRVMATAAAQKWHDVMLTKWLPKLKSGDTIAIGCSRGHHRSVSLAVVFAADLRAHGFTVNLVNRDISKTW